MIRNLEIAGYTATREPEKADVLIVNTCGFIGPAKQESIDAIFEMARYKQIGRCKKLVVTGCLSQRYGEELMREMPEVDLVLGVSQYADIARLVGLEERVYDAKPRECAYDYASRTLTTPPPSAYVRIADGCSNRCAYCAIPYIRGPLNSRDEADIEAEVQALCSRGIQEVTLVAQDTTAYGLDRYRERRLASLLKRLCRIDGLRWLRVLYCYPDGMTDGLLEVLAGEEKICKYIDLPIQHADAGVLKKMGRRGGPEQIADICGRLRSMGFALRTSVIVGFPGETEEAFFNLKRFLTEHPFDRLGVFAYSQEEGTPAAEFPNQIDERVKKKRRDEIMRAQIKFSRAFNESRLGKEYEVLIEGEENGRAFGRTRLEAPEIDPKVIISCKDGVPPAGTFARVRITGFYDYDIMGELI